MSYLGYVMAAYAVFVLILAWDFMMPRLQLRGLLRAARRRQARAESAVASAKRS